MLTRLVSSVLRLLLLTLPVSQVLADADWSAGDGDWFVPGDWTPAVVPTAADDVFINNAGTARADSTSAPAALEARNLFVATDGGSGSLLIDDSARLFLDIDVDANVDVGVVNAGAGASNGELAWQAGLGDLDNVGVSGNLRVGVSAAAGNATGMLSQPGGGIYLFDDLHVGVASASGDASGEVLSNEILGADSGELLIGVSSGSGNATGSVATPDYFDPDFAPFGAAAVAEFPGVAVGRAEAAGDADGSLVVSGGLGLLGAFFAPSGDLDVGVSEGAGNAVGVGDVSGDVSAFAAARIGVSTSTGTADGTLTVRPFAGFFDSAIDVDSLEVGTGSGATGELNIVEGLVAVAGHAELGAGSTLRLGLHGTDRATGAGSIEVYSAVNAATASLDGAGSADFYFVPDAGTHRFELLAASAPGGVSGDFASFDVLNLNQGFTVTSAGKEDGNAMPGDGDELYVVTIDGAPVTPAWINPAMGGAGRDWFDPGNWSSALPPGLGDPSVIGNAGVATAGIDGPAPGAMQAFTLDVGVDGGDGGLVSEGVSLETRRDLRIGHVSAAFAGGGTTTGTVSFTDATLEVGGNPDPGTSNTGLRVGVSEGGVGMAVGSLTLTRTDLEATRQVEVGRADDDNTAGAHGMADGTLVIQGAGIGVTTIDIGDDLDVAEAFTDSSTGSATALGNVTVTDASVRIRGDIEIADISDNNDGTASATGGVLLERVDLVVDSTLDVADVDSENDGDATGVGTLTVRDSTVLVRDELRLADTDAFDNATTDATATVVVENSMLQVLGDIEVSFGDATDTASARGVASLTVRDSTLIGGDDLFIADGEAIDPGSLVDLEGSVLFERATVDIAEDISVGALFGDSTQANRVHGSLTVVDSDVTAELLEVAFDDSPAGSPSTVSGEVRISGSVIKLVDQPTDVQDLSTLGEFEGLLDTHEGSSLVFDIEGFDRGMAVDGYGAIDAIQAFLDGDMTAIFGFIPTPGTHSFDLIRALTDPGVALDVGAAPGINGDFSMVSVLGLHPSFWYTAGLVFAETIDGVEYDIYRLTIFAPAPASLLLLATGLVVVCVGAARRRARTAPEDGRASAGGV